MQVAQLPPQIQQLIAQMQGQGVSEGGERVVGSRMPLQSTQLQQLQTLARLNIGDAIWAEVLKNEGGAMQLKLPSGEVFSARQDLPQPPQTAQTPQTLQQPQVTVPQAGQNPAQILPRQAIASAPTPPNAPESNQQQPQTREAQPIQRSALPVGETLMFTVTDKAIPKAAFRNLSTPAAPRLTVTLTDPKLIAAKNIDMPKLLRAFGAEVTARLPGEPPLTAEQTQVNERNISIAREIISGGLPPSKDNFQAISAALQKNPELTPKQAVFMVRENIPVTPRNIANFQQFLEHKNLVGEQLQNILTLLDDVPEQPPLAAKAAPQAPQQPVPAQPQQIAARPETAQIPLEIPEEIPGKLEQTIASLFRKVDPQHAHRLPREMNAAAIAREISEAVELLNERLERSPLPQESPARAVLQQAVRELDTSARFMNQLNNFTPVVTIPLQWGDSRTTAELYVFNDSEGKKRVDPQNATVFLSLMTANVGRVETFIKVLGKNVECDFKLELEETAAAVSGNMTQLSDLLDEQGYHLARTSSGVADRANDIFDVSQIREENKARYFFDRKV
ncbi:hypothetical protein FACS1894202_04450 [Clostridia bacterium]|nr:hypothetical protein FACS1894202_04450 [Clostridia bacterium]